jgi:hypothetical protein
VAPVYFLKLDGIDAPIELESFAWSEPAGPPGEPQTVTFAARTSGASPSLLVKCASGEHVATALLSMQDGNTLREWLFSDVAVTSYSASAGTTGPMDTVELTAAGAAELPRPALRFELLRPDDLLNLQVEVVNLRLDASDPHEPALVVDDTSAPAALIVTLPPQSIAERAYFEAALLPGAVTDPDPSPPPRPDSDAGKTDREPLSPLGTPGLAAMAQPSRLVFAVPNDARLPYTTAGVLDWSKLGLTVSPIAAIPPDPTPEQIAAAPSIQPPTPTQTALELPYRLVISPNGGATWVHKTAPFSSRGRTELWHTRLALRAEDGTALELSRDRRAPLRAIWSPDYRPGDPPEPTELDPLGRTAMAPNDRYQIVILTSAFHGWETNPALQQSGLDLELFAHVHAAGRLSVLRRPLRTPRPFVPTPFDAEQLMLTPLGGWLRSRGHWDPPRRSTSTFVGRPDLDAIFASVARRRDVVLPPALEQSLLSVAFAPTREEILDLSEWVHVATQGRDHYVRIVYEGRLRPFGHRASLVKVTERKFIDDGGIVVAHLTQRMFIVVREQVRSFDDRAMPFKRVRLTTLVTPDIAEPSVIASTHRSFWVEVVTADAGRRRFMFHAVGTDHGDANVDFTIPMIFESLSDDRSTAVADEYNASSDAAKLANREAQVPGQRVMFAAATDPSKRNTELVTDSLNFVLDRGSNSPKLLKADVRVPQVEELLGNNHPTTIRMAKDFAADGMGGATGVFAEVAAPDFSKFTPTDPFAGIQPTTLGLDFHSDQAGGFATPNMGVSALSRELGPLGSTLADARSGSFDPSTFFATAGALLFGSLPLAKLLKAGSLDGGGPTMTTKTSGTETVTTIEWHPSVQAFAAGPVKFTPDLDDKASAFDVTGKITRPSNPAAGDALFEFTGTITNFRVDILDSVFVNFRKFGVVAVSKQKPDVTVLLNLTEPITFHGDLQFVEELRQVIPPDLFGDGPSLDISPSGIHAGFAIGLPPVAVGVFALKDVQLGAGLTLPFVDGKPVLDFNVSSREHPFLLAVAIFGGGGFFHLQVDTAGLKELEAALEFGATASLDIGVASGSVHMMAGIYFSLQRKDPGNDLQATLTGYLRVGGSLTVLALVTVSVEFNLSFTYAEKGKAYGRATLTVQIEIAFFSKSVELTVERTFAGQGGDPTFRELFTTSGTWSEYALAFARKET